MERHDSFCVLCRSRCGARYLVEAERLVGVEPWPEHPTGGGLCAKGRAAPELQSHPQRLSRPLRRTTPRGAPDPCWQEVGWDEALDDIAARLRAIRDAHGAHAVAFSSASPGASGMSDSLDWLERLIFAFGSPNFLTGVELCNWHRDHNHAFSFGTGIGMPDYAHTDLVLLWGFNPGNVWLAQAQALAQARARGARLIVIDPARTRHAQGADLWLQPRPGTDAALALGLARELMHTQGWDEAFVRQWSNACFLVRDDTGCWLKASDLDPATQDERPVAWDEAAGAPVLLDTGDTFPETLALRGRHVVRGIACRTALECYAQACEPWTPERVQQATGIATEPLRQAAQLLAASRRTSYFSWTGIAQHANATQTDRAIALLYALTGCVDAPGGNRHLRRLPVNAPNDRALMDPAQAKRALGLAQRPLGPPAHGWALADDFQRAALEGVPYRVRALVGFGANLVLSQPDSARTAAALQALEFQVHCDLFENPTARHADYLLPVATPWEREGLRIGFEIGPRAVEQVQLRRAVVPAPPGNLARSDLDIVFALATRLGLGALFCDGDTDAAQDHVLAPLGLTMAQLRSQPAGVRVPVQQLDRAYGSRLPDGRVTGFGTPSRRVELHSDRLARAGIAPVPHWVAPADGSEAGYPLTLSSAKSGYYCQSQHRALPSLRQREPQPLARLHPLLARRHGIAAGDWMEVRTHRGSARYRAELDATLAEGTVLASFGWWQGCDELGLPAADPLAPGHANPNAIVDATLLDGPSGSAPLRSLPCAIARVEAAAGWDGAIEALAHCSGWPSSRVLELQLSAADGRCLPDHLPGQHVRIAMPLADGTACERCYSLVGAAVQGGRRSYRIAVGLARDGGRLSAALHRLFRSDPKRSVALRLWRPAGSFLLPGRPSRPVVLLAAGVGITPFMSLLEGWAADPVSLQRAVLLLHGSRNADEQPYARRLAEIAQVLPQLQLQALHSASSAGSRVRVGAQHVAARWIEQRATFHVCGPPAMYADTLAGLLARGVPRHDIFSEAFSLALQAPPTAPAGQRVRFVRSGVQALWSASDTSLLALAERLGVPLSGGCRVGQCESCKVGLLAGQVWHGGTPPPLDAHECLACTAVPVSDLEIDA
jgi:anaerobic selenocysteine-containing dehydrogenase/ferredoxin-NADP reductase